MNEFNAIYELADQWFKNAMDIALLALQRLGTVTGMRFLGFKKIITGRKIEFLYVI